MDKALVEGVLMDEEMFSPTTAIYVPDAALGRYSAAPVWSEMNLLPVSRLYDDPESDEDRSSTGDGSPVSKLTDKVGNRRPYCIICPLLLQAAVSTR